MAFWSSPTTSPKRQYRWIMNIGGIPQWIVKKVNKPGFSISESTHKYLNHTFYYPGRVEYEKTSVTLVDPVSPDAAAIMMRIEFSPVETYNLFFLMHQKDRKIHKIIV